MTSSTGFILSSRTILFIKSIFFTVYKLFPVKKCNLTLNFPVKKRENALIFPVKKCKIKTQEVLSCKELPLKNLKSGKIEKVINR